MTKGSWREFDDDLKKQNSIEGSDCPSKHNQRVMVSKSKSGRAGKIVTIITGLKVTPNDAKSLLKELKIHCGTGGTWKSDILELQGNHVNDAINFLGRHGYQSKMSGG